MGSILPAELDAHQRAGGTVVAASDRAARAIVTAFHRARQIEGHEAWFAPRVMDWQSFVRAVWQERTADFRLPLNTVQEQSLWERIIAESGGPAAVLQGPRRNLASMAMHAHALLCQYAPRFLDARTRGSWDHDSAAFSRLLSAFETLCRDLRVVSPNRLVLETIPLLAADPDPRPDLLLAGFDRLVPVQHELLNAWGNWLHAPVNEPAGSIRFFTAPDASTELAAVVAWCGQRLSAQPQHRILVVAQDVRERRGEFERFFLKRAASTPAFNFEFSLGVPLQQTAPARNAQLLLRWLDAPLGEHELDWLFSTPYATATAESATLQARMRALRNRGMQRPQWSLRTFLDQPLPAFPLPAAWVQRLNTAQSRLRSLAQQDHSPMEWAEIVPQLLETTGWPGASAASAEFQVIQRWQQAVESCGSLGFDGRRIPWQHFLSDLIRITDETLFAPESEDARILITGPAESAGITADAIWFLGADEDAWPARGDLHPLLPADLQRRAGMPHSSPQADWDLAHATTARLLASAPEICFSHARLMDGVEKRPSRLVAEFAGTPHTLPNHLIPAGTESLLTISVEDTAAVPYRTSAADPAGAIHLRGGASLLTAQSQCPFQAFAIGRLGASDWEPADAALTAAERGQLLHAVLHAVWGDPPHGIRSLRELQNRTDLQSFVAAHVQRALSAKALSRVREEMPARYLEIETTRLTRLITEWLNYERTRADFEVVDTERTCVTTIAGISLDLRLDRLDRLNDDSLLVIDYKTGDVSPKSWDLPRPDDVQLPLYAGFGIDEGELVGGLVFAKIRAGEMCFAGRVVDAAATLDHNLKSSSSLLKHPMTAEQLMDWRDVIEQLARDFLAGRAHVDPRDPVTTCERCGLQTLCRIHEREPAIEQLEAEVNNE
jgi:probable DNA repair protein